MAHKSVLVLDMPTIECALLRFENFIVRYNFLCFNVCRKQLCGFLVYVWLMLILVPFICMSLLPNIV